MVKGYEIPATLLRRGLGRIVEKSMQGAFPGTGMHAVPRDLVQYYENTVVRCLTQQVVLTSGGSIYGSGVVGD